MYVGLYEFCNLYAPQYIPYVCVIHVPMCVHVHMCSDVAKVGNGWAQTQPIMSSAQPIFMSSAQPIFMSIVQPIYMHLST